MVTLMRYYKLTALVLLVLPFLGVTSTASAEPMLVCKATINAIDSLDNNCDGYPDDEEEIEQLGKLTGTDWYLYPISSLDPESLCFQEGSTIQCQSHKDTGLGNCVGLNKTGNYLCTLATSSGSTAGGSNTNNGGSGSHSNAIHSGATGSGGTNTAGTGNRSSSTGSSSDEDNESEEGTVVLASNNAPAEDEQENPNASICLLFDGIEKCISDPETGYDCIEVGTGHFYCAAEPNQQPDPELVCIATTEIYNGIDDNCNGEIDEGVNPPPQITRLSSPLDPENNPPSVALTQGQPNASTTVVEVPTPTSLAIFGVGVVALLMTRRKTKSS